MVETMKLDTLALLAMSNIKDDLEEKVPIGTLLAYMTSSESDNALNKRRLRDIFLS